MPKEEKPVSRSGNSENSNEQTNANQGSDAISILKSDHRAVDALFQKYENSEETEKSDIINEINKALVIHTLVEEEIFYPACAKIEDNKILNEAQVEHDTLKFLIEDLEDNRENTDYRDAKVKVLSEYVKHHVGEEEKPGDGIMAQAQAAGINNSILATRISQRKAELEQQERIPPIRLVALHPLPPRAYRPQLQEYDMPQYQTRDRDSRGRFTSDRDHYSSRGNDRPRDDQGRFMSEGRGYAHRDDGRYGRDDDDRRSRSGHYDDDDRYRGSRSYGDYDYRSSRGSRYDDDDDYYRSGRYDDDNDDYRRSSGHGGWFGDSRGHSEAARRGWDNRGHSYSSRDDDDRDRSGRGHGGWFGDSRGHAEAARRGWEGRR